MSTKRYRRGGKRFPQTDKKEFEDSHLYRLWENRVKKGDPNDLVIAVAPSSKTGVSGVGKTTLALQLAKRFDISPSGFDAEDKATMRNYEITDIYEQSEPGSAAIWDEAQGTKENSGVDSRRAMKSENLDAIRDVALNRNANMTLILVSQSTSWLDKRLMELIDALLVIMTKGVAKHFSYFQRDLDFSGEQEYTPCMGEVSWSRLPATDSDYKTMEKMKEDAKREAQEEGKSKDPDEIKRQKKIEIAQNMRENGKTLAEIADDVEMSEGWVSNNTKSPG